MTSAQAEREAVVAFLTAEHDRMMNNAGWLKLADGGWIAAPEHVRPTVETHNHFVGRANAIFAVRAMIARGDHHKGTPET